MKLKQILKTSLIIPELQATNKEEVLTEMLDLLCQEENVSDRDTVLQLLEERESKMSTGMQEGVALPHTKTDAVDHLVACIAIKKEGIDFDSVDGKKSQIFIMTLSPSHCVGPHLKFLSDIMAVLGEPLNRKRLLRMTTSEQILLTFLGEPA